MGADGHVAFYDKLKVDKISKEIYEKYGFRCDILSIGRECNYRVNGQYCYIVYWDVGKNGRYFGWELFHHLYKRDGKINWNDIRAIKEFEDRIKTEATLVEDQEVWT